MNADLLAGFLSGAALIMAIGAQNSFVLREGIRREHVLPIVLVCAAMYSAMRYRMDFAPFMTLAAFVGYPAVMRASFGPERRRVIGYGIALCLFGIVASHYVLLIHKVWSTGVPYDVRERLQPYAAFSKEPLEH